MANSSKNLPIKYVFDPPSLKNMALVTIAIKICGWPNKCNDCNSTNGMKNENSIVNFVEFNKRMSPSLEEIALPSTLKHEVLDIIRRIERQLIGMIDWADGEYFDLKILYEKRDLFYWTMDGMFNMENLHKVIFDENKVTKYKHINYTTLYENACMYCMEEYISDFWSKLPKERRQFQYYVRRYHLQIVAYWTASLCNELPMLRDEIFVNDSKEIYDRNSSLNENMISSFIVSSNWIAFKYFWNHKLIEEEKKSNIKKWILLLLKRRLKIQLRERIFEGLFDLDDYNWPCNYRDDHYRTYIIFLLLTHLDSLSEQKEIFEAYPMLILKSLFFHWPLQRYFFQTIKIMLDSLQENVYVAIMLVIIYNVLSRRTAILFRDIWDISPPNLKKSFLNYLECNGDAMTRLLFSGDDITIYAILRNATVIQKWQILIRMAQDPEIFDFLKFYNNSVKMAVEKIERLASCNLSKNDLYLFKQEVMSYYGGNLSSEWILSNDYASLNIFWDWASPSQEECNKLKKKCIDLKHVHGTLLFREDSEQLNYFLNWYFEFGEYKKSSRFLRTRRSSL